MSAKTKKVDPSDPTRDMTGYGFRKELIWRELVLDTIAKKVYVEKYHFSINRFPCYNCKTEEYSWLKPQKLGVYKTCLGCTQTMGPLSKDDAVMIGSRTEISPEEAFAIFSGRGIKRLPSFLRKLLRVRRSRVSRVRPSKDIEEF